jgi:hypothetical protein
VRTILFTDGAKYVADNGGAYWLLDEIAFAQKGEKAVAAEALRGLPGGFAPVTHSQVKPLKFRMTG